MYTTTTLQAMGRSGYNYGDTTQPQLRPAGATTRIDETAKDALTWNPRPPTPPQQRKYRQLAIHEPGTIIRHHGSADDPIPEGPFGNRTVSKPGDSVAENIKGMYPSTEMGRWALEQAEDVYDSSKKEPLGRGYRRGHKIPDQLGTTRPFGVTLGAKELDRANQLKHVVFPTDVPPEPDDKSNPAHQLYVRSHQAYLPGEQRSRSYDWDKTGVDPLTHTFGYKDKEDAPDGVRSALQPELDQGQRHPPTISSKLLEDHRLATRDKLGTVRKTGQGDQRLPPDHTYGMPSLRPGQTEPSVYELLQNSWTPEQQQADADLGKSLREGWRNIAPDSRTFGVPTIRLDRPMPQTRSCASSVNYGNEPDALQLLRPPRHVERGINESHFIQLRSKDEIRDLAEEAEIHLPDDQFDAIFKMASEADGEEGRCCLDTFFRARHYVLAKTL